MNIEEMNKLKAQLGYSNEELSVRSGVPASTIQKILSGKTKKPHRNTLLALAEALSRQLAEDSLNVYTAGPGPSTAPDLLRDAPAPYGQETSAANVKKQGEYTLEDYLALPEEQRVELIDGVLYDLAAPTTVHQAIGGFIHKLLLDHVLSHGGPCMPFISPVDVQLDEDDRTVVQPDVLVVCDKSKFRNGRVFGAPDLVIEVLSPSTQRKDVRLKLYKYGNAGVREYWLVYPDKKKVVVHDLENYEIPVIYSFEDTVPVGIWSGECLIDFKEIYSHISFLYD